MTFGTAVVPYPGPINSFQDPWPKPLPDLPGRKPARAGFADSRKIRRDRGRARRAHMCVREHKTASKAASDRHVRQIMA